jgi:F-type H+-transporting ATPase subunit a
MGKGGKILSIEISMKAFGREILIPDSVVNSWIIGIVMTIIAIIAYKKFKKYDPESAPSGFQNFIEMVVEVATHLTTMIMGEERISFMPYIGTLFTFLLVSNLFGLLGFTPPTSDYSVTLTLALMTFALVEYHRAKSKGFVGFFKSFTEPLPLLTPLNVIDEFANPISLSFRLYGNIMSGALIMSLVYGAAGFFAPIFTPILHAYFDVFSGVLQAFIFTMLTMIFISGVMD